MGAADIAKALGGHPIGGGQYLVRCPLPSHGQGRGDRRPSLSIMDDPDDAGDVIVNCQAGCDWREVKDELRGRGLLPERGCAREPRRRPVQALPYEHRPDPAALGIWNAARREGDAMRAYLQHRGIGLRPPPSLRQGTDVRMRVPVPVMVAAVQAPDRQVVAVQTTALTWAGRKAPISTPRITTGALGRGAVRLGPAGETLGLAEGVETALSAMELQGLTVWAVLGARRLGSIGLPPEVRHIVIFGDNDAPGLEAAEQARSRYRQAGLAVDLQPPPSGFGDWNDYARAQAGDRAA